MARRMTNRVAELEAESDRILDEMSSLRDKFVQTKKSGQGTDLALLEQMEATSRRFREVNEKMYALASGAPLAAQ